MIRAEEEKKAEEERLQKYMERVSKIKKG